MVAVSLQEVKRMLSRLLFPPGLFPPEFPLNWMNWRRRQQAAAMRSHFRKRRALKHLPL
jgi:hypothetical protein